MSQVSARVRGINALVTVVDFAAAAIGSAEGELAQKDAALRQLSELLARCEREKAAADAEAIELAAKLADARERAVSEVKEKEELVELIRAFLRKRDSVADAHHVSLLDGELNELRSIVG